IHGEGEITQGTHAQRRGAVSIVQIARVDDVWVVNLDQVVACSQRGAQGDRQGETDMLWNLHGSSLPSEAQVDTHEPVADRRLRDEVAYEEVVPVEPLRLTRLTLAVHLGVHAGVIRPRVQVATGERDARALGAELLSHRLRQVVRDGQFAQLDEPTRFDEPERGPPGGRTDEAHGHHPSLLHQANRLVILRLAALPPGAAAELLGEIPELVAAAIIQLSPNSEAVVEQGQPSI